MYAVVETRRLVAAHATQDRRAVEFCKQTKRALVSVTWQTHLRRRGNRGTIASARAQCVKVTSRAAGEPREGVKWISCVARCTHDGSAVARTALSLSLGALSSE